MQNNDTTIQFSGLASGRYTFDYRLDDTFFQTFENDELTDGDVHFTVELEKREHTLLFRLAFQGQIRTVCDRCLGDLAVDVSGQQMLCVKLSDNVRYDEDDGDADVVFLPENECKIDLAQYMYEDVVLALPMQRMHPDGECDADMLQRLASNSTLDTDHKDPRWDALRQLMND